MRKYELTNEVMEDRARMGLSVWVCRNLHRAHHCWSVRSYDKRWDILSKDCKCLKCGRTWLDLSPLMNVIEKHLCESVSPAIEELMAKKDPVYALIGK